MANKSVLLISTEFPPGPGGIGKHAYDLARALSAKEYFVNVFTSQDFCSSEEINSFNNVNSSQIKINTFERNGLFTQYNRWVQIRIFLSNQSPDFIIVTGRFSLWLGGLIKIIYTKTYTVHAFVHGSELKSKNKIFNLLTKQSLRNIDCIWAVSNFTKQIIKNILPKSEPNILPNGLWFDDWNKLSITNTDKILSGEPSLLTVGQISFRKGQLRVVKALPEIIKYFPNAQYHIVGLPTHKSLVQSTAAALNVYDKISIYGKVAGISDLASYYTGSKIFIMLSENQSDGDAEGFGIAILEANYFGIPAIGAKGCGIEDAIKDGYNGVLVDGNNHEEITQAIKDILNNYDSYSQNAKKWSLKHDWLELIIEFEKIANKKLALNKMPEA